jgi:hypothetical protein
MAGRKRKADLAIFLCAYSETAAGTEYGPKGQKRVLHIVKVVNTSRGVMVNFAFMRFWDQISVPRRSVLTEGCPFTSVSLGSSPDIKPASD